MKNRSLLVGLAVYLVAMGFSQSGMADDKLTLYDRNKRNVQSQGYYNRNYDRSPAYYNNQGSGSSRSGYYYDDYNSQNRGAIGRPPRPPQ